MPNPANGPARYINSQAFQVHLNETGVFLAYPLEVLKAMNGALEDEHSQDNPEVRDAWVLGATQWILWNGQQLFKLMWWRDELGTPSQLVGCKRDDGGYPVPWKDCWNDWKRGFE
ncbi:hypothetical protein BGW36DRAFT_362284 [Talaromyces proteolyticus]|uniref:Uncharacterized protein n=1 Tax=Talaromyces proteolyticus TaxID=1131652 RepID=A0AAD4KJ63_9EURO|nr:uncharacterized protein BGW36DRAFT_362284 [Talaromyces proteolyticus]KAH8692735.1 hypothetical protein BGW36DRAFT_362284 [Talaromyces proteolyticus]